MIYIITTEMETKAGKSEKYYALARWGRENRVFIQSKAADTPLGALRELLRASAEALREASDNGRVPSVPVDEKDDENTKLVCGGYRDFDPRST